MIDQKSLTKGQTRKLNALRKSLGDKIADQAFAQWLAEQPARGSATENDRRYSDNVLMIFNPIQHPF